MACESRTTKEGKILVFAAETIADPGAHAGAAWLHEAGLDKGDGGIVIDGVRVDGFNERDVVHDLGGVRKQFADPGSVRAGAV